jgi:hypothetical protein
MLVTVRVISAYAPQKGHGDEEKDKFYEELNDEMGQAGIDDFVVLLGDLNGHVGADADGYEGVHGGFGYGDRNMEGCRVLEFGEAHGLVVGNTWFKRLKDRLVTYRSGNEKTVIDYVLVREKDRKLIRNVKVIPGLLQHGLLVMDIISKEMGKKVKKKFVPRRKTWLLRNAEVKKEFEEKMAENWKSACGDGNVWVQYKNCVLKVADEVCGWTKGRCRHGETWWWNENVRAAVEEKKARFKEWIRDRTEVNKLNYNRAKKCAKKAVAVAVKEASDKLVEEMESDKTSKVMFKAARQAVKDRKDVIGSGFIRNEMGKMCYGDRERSEAWKRHMEKVMNEENEWDGEVEADVVQGPIERVTAGEVMRAIKAMKLGKASGVTEVVAEHVVASGKIGVEVMAEICNRVLAGESMPEDWRDSVLVPLYKGKGDARDCGAYRGVKLLEHGMKIVERVFERRLREVVEVNDMQCGFMPGKGTIDALFMVRMLQEKYDRKKKKLYMCFVDLEKAFDRVPREVIRWALRKKGVNENLVEAVMRLYIGARTKVRVGNGLSEAFEVKVGLHQGSVLSPLLFIVVMDAVCGGVMEGLLYEILYADDLVLMADSMEELQVKFDKWKDAIEKKGMKVNMGKTKVMVSGEEGERVVSRVDPCSVCDKRVKANSVLCVECRKWVHKRCSGVVGSLKKVEGVYRCRVCVQGRVVADVAENMGDGRERVRSFVYLGDKLNAGGGCLSAVTARIRAGWKKFKELCGVLYGRKWSLKLKGKVYKACVRTAMVYGSETWVMTKAEEGVLRRAERAMVRMMSGVKLRDRKSSSELMSMTGLCEDIVVVARRSRLRWYGHVLRKTESDGTREVLEVVVPGKVGRGRPKLGWEEEAKKDMIKVGLGIGDAKDRGRWRRGLHGLS